MQRDWNERAREDANFYVAFGRRDQDSEEFFATAREVVAGLEWEMRRLPAARPRARRALEIGCGPGRLIRPLSRHFGEIHGVDVSDEMIRRAEANLAHIAHAHPHHTSGADLDPFADESFDFVYSYAVFQHIPSRDVVMQYLREAVRVLKPGGILRAQINGLDATARQYDTWSGVRIAAAEVREFAREHGLQLLALEGARTQYMWTTMRKPGPLSSATAAAATRIRRLTNAHNSEPVAPRSGRFASVTAWIENLPPEADLLRLRAQIGGVEATPCYIGPAEPDGLQQFNVLLPELPRTGLLPLHLALEGEELCEPRHLRVIAPGPAVPVVLSVTDGINMLSGTHIVSRSVKVTVEEAQQPQSFEAVVDEEPVRNIDIFCADPLPPRHEINFDLPEGTTPGAHRLRLYLRGRRLHEVEITVGDRNP
jgi:SAM-dependent methyltransferase